MSDQKTQRPRRKQACPVKYDFSDDSNDLSNQLVPIELPLEKKRSLERYSKENRNKDPTVRSSEPILLKFRIKNSSSSDAYVETVPVINDDNEEGERKVTQNAENASQNVLPRRTRGKLKQPGYFRTGRNLRTTSAAQKCRRTALLKKYQTYPKTFKTDVVKFSLENGVAAAARKFGLDSSKIKMWLKFKHVMPKAKCRSTETEPLSSYPAAFKLFAIQLAEEKSCQEAASLLSLKEDVVNHWVLIKDQLLKKAGQEHIPQWETDVFVGMRRDLINGHEVKVQDLLDRAKSFKMDDKESLSMQWVKRWCGTFGLLLQRTSRREADQGVTVDTQLHLSHEEVGVHLAKETKIVQKNKKPLGRKTIRSKNQSLNKGIAKIDAEIWRWYKMLEKKGRKLTKAIVCARARHVLARHGYADFKASDGWYRLWKRRCSELNNMPLSSPHSSDTETEICDKPEKMCLEESSESPSTISEHSSHPPDHQEMKGNIPEKEIAESVLSKNTNSNTSLRIDSDITCSHSKEKANDSSMDNQSDYYVDCLATESDNDSPVVNVAPSERKDYSSCELNNTVPVRDGLKIQPLWSQDNLNSNKSYSAQPSHSPTVLTFHDSLVQSLIHGNADLSQAAEISCSSGESYYNDAGNELLSLNGKKKNERYLPEFKLEVVKYALQSTFKKTAEKFGVHHSTIAEWCKNKEKLEKMFPSERSSLCKEDSSVVASYAEQLFMQWLKECNANKRKLQPADVRNKVKEIIDCIGEQEVEKSCRWLYVWHKRRLEIQKLIEGTDDLSETTGKESRIAFPPLIKLEIVKIAERQKFTETAECFQIDRNSLSDWNKAQSKLRSMAKEGKVRKKEISKSAKAIEAETEIYEWYQEHRKKGEKPGPNEVRAKAVEIYKKHGDTIMKCSIGWYSRWSKRFGIQLRYEKDDEILEWVLTQLEQNKTITHSDIQKQAVTVLSNVKTGFKCSAGWPIRFCKRHQALLQKQPLLSTPLPDVLEEKVNGFCQWIQKLQDQLFFTNAAIGAMDEVPLYFSGGSSSGGSLLIRRCGFENAHAVVLLACLADGAILPPFVVVKGVSSLVQEQQPSFVTMFMDHLKVDASVVQYWIDNVWCRYVPAPSLLILDSYEQHFSSEIRVFSQERNVNLAVIPGGCSTHTHPVVVWLRRKFQALVSATWVKSALSKSVPSPQDVVDCITSAWHDLQTCQDAIRNSFTVTGVILTSDHSEDDLVRNSKLLPEINDEFLDLK